MSTFDDTELTARTATELLDLYRRGEASPVEATTAVLDRIEKVNPTINAYCLVDADAALASARESEARWQRGGRRRARRCTDLDQGSDPRQGLADAARQPHRRRQPALGHRRTRHCAAARGRCGAAGQDQHARVRLQGRDQFAAHRHHAQPVGSQQDARGLVGRHGRSDRRGPGPAVGGHRRRRQRAHPGRVLRQLRLEAELRPRTGSSAVAVRHRRAPGPAHDERARRGADADGAGPARRARLDLAAARWS